MDYLYFANVSSDGSWNNVLNWFIDYQVTLDAVAPATPAYGDIWYDTVTATSFIWTAGSPDAWVAGGQALNVPWVSGDNLYLAHNLSRSSASIATEDYVYINADILVSVLGNCDIGYVDDLVAGGSIGNSSNIYGGTFSGANFSNSSNIYGGTFSGDNFYSPGYIYGGTFSGDNFYSPGYINGGTFSGDYFTNTGSINGGTFSGGSFSNSSYIYGGYWLEKGNLMVSSYDFTLGETITKVVGRYSNPYECTTDSGLSTITASSDILGTGLL